MKLLALDCSTELCSVALYENSGDAEAGTGAILAEESLLAARAHTQRLLPMVESVLAAGQCRLGDLDGIGFGRGPGSFTGLRIALGAVQGMAFGADLPVMPVSTLAVLAQTAVDNQIPEVGSETTVISALDARMDEIYWAVYGCDGRLVELRGDEHLTAPRGMTTALLGANGIGVGSGWDYADQIPAAGDMGTLLPGCQPMAGSLARLADRVLRNGLAVSANQALPTYLRDEVAWRKVK